MAEMEPETVERKITKGYNQLDSLRKELRNVRAELNSVTLELDGVEDKLMSMQSGMYKVRSEGIKIITTLLIAMMFLEIAKRDNDLRSDEKFKFEVNKIQDKCLVTQDNLEMFFRVRSEDFQELEKDVPESVREQFDRFEIQPKLRSAIVRTFSKFGFESQSDQEMATRKELSDVVFPGDRVLVLGSNLEFEISMLGFLVGKSGLVMSNRDTSDQFLNVSNAIEHHNLQTFDKLEHLNISFDLIVLDTFRDHEFQHLLGGNSRTFTLDRSTQVPITKKKTALYVMSFKCVLYC